MGSGGGGLSSSQKRDQALTEKELNKKRARLALDREFRKRNTQVSSPLVSSAGERGILGPGAASTGSGRPIVQAKG